MKIGVIMSSFRVPAYEALAKAADVGADGVQLRNERGELSPDELDAEGRRRLRQELGRLGLEISALCADYGRSYAQAKQLGWLVPSMKKVVDLANDLEVGVITTHIGVVPEDPDDPARAAMAEALSDVGGYAGERGVKLATETGPESPAALAQFLREVDSPGLAVNYDPANLVMNGFDHLAGVGILAPWIVHTHAKDAVRHPDGRKEEVPLGEGSVDFPTYLRALRQVGFDGYLTVEREVGDDPERDIRAAVSFLKGLDIR